MHLSSSILATLMTSAMVAQMPIPPHSLVVTGYSSGLNFTANIPFLITQLDLPLDAQQPGDTASYLVRINGATALWSIGNVGAIQCSIVVLSGDVVDVIGNWSPAVPGSSTAHNSVASGWQYLTTIAGVAHTLSGTGWQWDVGDPTWVSSGATGSYVTPGGSMGRVFVYTVPVGTPGTNTTLGQGCSSFQSLYEYFATAGSFDLSYTSMSLLRSSGGYTARPGITSYVPPSPAAAIVAAGDDVEQTVWLTGTFPYPGGTTSSLTVCSNGFVSVAPGNNIHTQSVWAMLAFPRTAWGCMHDYWPTGGPTGAIKFEVIGGIACFTWDAVPGAWSSSPSTWQLQFDMATGNVHYVWQAMGYHTGDLVFYSPGGPNLDPGSTDLSVALAGGITLGSLDIPPLSLTGTRPVIGTSWNLTTGNIGWTAVFGVEVFGTTDPGLNDLAFLGMPGCGLRASLDVLNVYVVTGAIHAYSLAIPASPGLIGIDVFTMSAVFAPLANAFGAMTSNGIRGFIGDV